MITPVILCGGSGSRLWPSSRASYPKQFSPLLGEESLFQRTVRRLSGPGYDAPIVLTHGDFRFLATEQLGAMGISDAQVIVEPHRRNTAPAVLTAALMLAEDPDGLMLVAPSDHVIGDGEAFRLAVETGAEAARAGHLVTFGIAPTRAETGYGYLELDPGAAAAHPDARPVRRFVEKPDGDRAAEMLAAGHYLWNAGLVLMRPGDLIAAARTHAPDLIAPCEAALARGRPDLDFFRLEAEAYGSAPDISLDYAVLERATGLVAVSYAGGWSDLGAWDALWEALERDGAGNALSGPATALGCRDSRLRAEEPGQRLVGLGLDRIVAVAMRDAVLVADMDAAQGVREVVDLLKAEAVPQATEYPRVHRPWGWYETLCRGTRFQVKRIMVRPGGVLSLQSHMHRSEHWVVVAGTAQVTVEGDERLVSENQSVYIPLGAQHRMENPGKVEMYLIEVQTGAYLGEDDITRFEDAYDRL